MKKENRAAYEASWRVLASVQVVLTDELCQIVTLLSERAYCHPLTAKGGSRICGLTSSSRPTAVS